MPPPRPPRSDARRPSPPPIGAARGRRPRHGAPPPAGPPGARPRPPVSAPPGGAEAAATLDTGTDAATVDALFEQCLGHRMGPLRTADLIGLDNVA
ncbi:3-hydroxyacyl-CoA dehydrogenase family protein, partial [Nocardia wallacei]|uniref:3-hydroxyacyl-CoA dehydrogenase family protein n=1 Tax=Nocardia wallacei TaxID=480035 RepID=UPI0024559A11